ncbi:unnamed protein product [Lactuca virosa]|uniref:Uncharacterized protein n=1 Tax=Lactuca virosa TaxID=75947 RepID=A0AAU9NTD0_9ASTR|nr:unnamed protein product [Lactuca virosa]
MPSFSLGLGLGLTQEFQEGDESSEDEPMKKEIKNEKLDEGESYDSEETECDNSILGIEDDEDKKREVGKRLKKPSLKLSSPYNKKEVCASKFVDPDEVKVSDRIFSRIGNSSEKVFQTKRGYMLGRGIIETMQAGLWVHAHVIDAWTDILNYEEKLKSNSTVNRYFFDTSIVRQFIFDKYIPFNEKFDKFESNIKDAMKKDKELLTFEKVHLVINYLEEPAVDVIDNRNSVAKFPRAYGDAPNELKILFSRYLMRVNHKSASTLEGVEPERVNMNWRTRDNHVDYGVFCMCHMETYMGDKTVNWTCGLPKESKQQQSVLNELRIKYLTKILLSDTNTYRSKIITQTAKFAKKTNEEIKDLLDKGWQKRGERI